MEGVWKRLCGARAKVYLLLGVLASCCHTSAARGEPRRLPELEGQPGVVIYPAQQPGPHRVTVVLHGMCSEPENACRHFASRVTEQEHLVCPRASLRCPAGGSIWPHRGFESQIEAAVTRAEAQLGDRLDRDAGRTLIGYSLGAFRALSLAQASSGKYPRVMLIGAKIFPSARLLREHGVRRLLLSAGEWDMMHAHMQRETQRLERAGFPARFLGLGPVGHLLTPTFDDYLPEALRWLHDDEATEKEAHSS
jgi:predicted esterase